MRSFDDQGGSASSRASSQGRGFALNGADVFMLAMDYDMRRNGSAGNICHLLVTLTPDCDVYSLCANLTATSLFQYVSRLRLHTPFLRAPRWQASGGRVSGSKIADRVVSEQDLHDWILQHRIDIRYESPLGFVALPAYHGGPSFLLYWHHSLCDAHGGELLLQSLASNESSAQCIPAAPPASSFRMQVTQARSATKLVFTKAAGRITRLVRVASTRPRHAYTKLRFSRAETACVDQLSLKLTAGIFSSALYLASSARAFAALTQAAQPLFIPVPHDIRRHTRERPPLSNQVSVVFFRLTPDDLNSLSKATDCVIEQLHEAITTHAQADYLEFLRLMRRVPIRLLWRIIEMPTQGHPASLYVSDIGSSLSSIKTILGHEVALASHYPPNLAPPGLTLVWSRYRDQLELTVCYDEAIVSRNDIEQCIISIKTEMTSLSSR